MTALGHRMLRRVVVCAIALVAAFSLAGVSSQAFADEGGGEQVTYYDGTYEGTGEGRNGDIVVSVTVENGQVAGVTVVSQSETPSYWAKIGDSFYQSFVTAQSADVDVVSGATLSCDGIKSAVEQALAKAQTPFEGGSGTADDPYVISTAQQLASFATSVDGGTSYAGQFVELGADIDLSGIESWNPIGTEAAATDATGSIFAGSFDGAGHTISGLTIALADQTSEVNVGFFSTLQNTASVKNLALTGVDIDVTSSAVIRAGAIAGDSVKGTNGDYTAAHAVIDSCSATGAIDVDTSAQALVFAGGIVGRQNISMVVSNSWTDLDATAFSRGGSHSAYAGGIFGTTGNNAAVVNCASFGDAKGVSPKSTNFGGMAGGMGAMFAGKMWNVAASGNQTIGNGGSKNSWIGAIAGECTTSGMDKDGNVYVYPASGTLRGYAYYSTGSTLTVETYNSGTGEFVSSAAADMRASGFSPTISTYDKVFETQTDIVKGLAAADMASESFASTMNGNIGSVMALADAYGLGDISLKTWILQDGKVIPAGTDWTDPDAMFVSGTGTESDPYIIATAAGLAKFAESVDEGTSYAGQFVELGADVDLSGIESWNPIGTEAAVSNADAPNTETFFAGTFDGAGHAVTGMKIDLADQASDLNVGLFSTLQNTATVQNLTLTGVDIDVTSSKVIRAGGIAGDIVSGTNKDYTAPHALVDSCAVTGSIDVDSSGQALVFAGGIAGRANITAIVVNSWTDVDATAFSRGGTNSAYAGGIFGMSGNNSAVVNCATFGDAKAASPKSTNFGGLAGGILGMSSSKIWNVAASGNQTIGNGGSPHTWIGMIAGENTTGIMERSGTNYFYPETGTLRGYAYYNDGAALNVETYNSSTGEFVSSAAADMRAAGFSPTINTYDKVFETQTDIVKGVAAADMASESFASTMNGNLRAVSDLIGAFELGDISLNTWQLVDGRVIPTGDAWVDVRPDASIFEGGSGTAEDPYQIKTEEQLRAFAASLSDVTDYTGLYVEVVDDIDASSAPWVPVGNSDYSFNGTFDGNGHTISGLHIGTADEAAAIDNGAIFVGMFSVLDADAVIKDVKLADTVFNVSNATSVYVGGIAAYMGGRSGDSRAGAVIDGCSVDGVLKATVGKGNTFVGGVAGYQYKGATINTCTDADVSVVVQQGSAVAEGGGIAGLVNRGLVANCYTLGDVYGSASRDNGDEGMASISALVGVNGGDIANCYGGGNHETGEYSVYVGAVSGWVTGIGKAYNSWYNDDSSMKIDTQVVKPVESIGTKVPSGVNDEGDAYTGGVVDKLTPYTASTYATIADGLNASFAEFPIDISLYGLEGDVFRTWSFDEASGEVTFGDALSGITYVRPQAEIVPPVQLTLRDGTWYGRDEAKGTVVAIEVADGEIVKAMVLAGDEAGDAYDAALAKAEEKAAYGDTSDYDAPDPSVFAGGSGTEADPYQVANEEQLRYIAQRLNEENTWNGVYFVQTADIELSSDEWLPIGWGIMTEIKNKATQYCLYPFLGNYDGGDHAITGLTIGTADEPSADPRMSYAAGFIGVAAGAANYNDVAQEGDRVVAVKNVHLKDAAIAVSSRYQNYVGGLAGNLQNGFFVDNCSVEGTLSSYSSESHARGGGLVGNALRGLITNSWTDVDVSVETDAGNAYGGALFSMDNRATAVNCYTLGSVTGNSGNNNKVHIGALTGQAGGYHYNCYAMGDVVSLKTTTDAGALNGRLAGISVERGCYFNTDAKLEVAGAQVETHVASGVDVTKSEEMNTSEGKSAAEMADTAFAQLLNDNVAATSDAIAKIRELAEAGTDLATMVYYTGDGSDLLPWMVGDGHAVFGTVDKTALESAIAGAAAAESGVKVSSNGSDVSNADTWVTPAAKTALDEAIAAAQDVMDNPDATQAQVDDAISTLNDAVASFNDAKKAGTKAPAKTVSTQIWKRVWGKTAPITMQAIAKEFGKAQTAIVTTDSSYKDALAGSALAGRYNAIVLMTKKDSLTPQTKAALKTAGVKNVFIVGSTGNVSAKVEKALKSGTGVKTVKRIAGTTPSQRAIAAAKATGKRSDTVIIATQNNFRDALSIAPFSYATKSPILYAETSKKLSAGTIKYIKSAKYKKAVIVGGPIALPASIDAQLKSAGVTSVTRLAGSNAYATSKQIASWTTGQLKNGNYGKYNGKTLAYVKFQPSVKMGANKLAVSTGQNWLDALAGAALCGKNKSALLLADVYEGAGHYSDAVAFCKANKSKISKAYVFGGTSAVNTTVWKALVASTK